MGATRDESSKEQVKMSPPAKIISADFRKRARHYRFAVALKDTPRDAVTFDGLAAMFDQIACCFRRAEMRLAATAILDPAAVTASPEGAIAR